MNRKFILLFVFIWMVFATSTATAIQLSETTIDFGTYYVGESLPTRYLKITNDHSENDLNILDFQFVGDDAESFRVVGASGTTRMAPGEEMTVLIQFTPTHQGPHQATYRIVSDDIFDPETSVLLMGAHETYLEDQWIFYFEQEQVIVDCPVGSDSCEGQVAFHLAPPLYSNCGGYPTPVDFVNAMKNEMQLVFEPCNQAIVPDYIGDPSYGMVYEQRNGSCAADSNAVCVVVAKIRPASMTLTGNDCHIRGVLAVTLSGTQNILNCTNYTYEDEDENDDPVTVETGFHFHLATEATAVLPLTGGLSYSDGLEIIVVGNQDQAVEDYTDLAYYSASIRVTDFHDALFDFELRIVDSTGGYVAMPSNVDVTEVEWIVDEVVSWTGTPPEGFHRHGYEFTGMEHVLRALAHIRFPSPSGPVNVVLKSNELKLYVPNPGECRDGSLPTAKNIPPVSNPLGGPLRSIFSNVTEENKPDYGDYTGTGDLSHIPLGFWHGGAAKNGIWGPWSNDNTHGRLGKRSFTFINALPWQIYEICPVAEVALPVVLNGEIADLPDDGMGHYHACSNPENLVCPTDSEGDIAWNLAWTTFGWLCLRHSCVLLEDNTTSVHQGEFWNCDE